MIWVCFRLSKALCPGSWRYGPHNWPWTSSKGCARFVCLFAFLFCFCNYSEKDTLRQEFLLLYSLFIRHLFFRRSRVDGSSWQWIWFSYLCSPARGLLLSIFPSILCESWLDLWKKGMKNSATSLPPISLVSITLYFHASSHSVFSKKFFFFFLLLAITSYLFICHLVLSSQVSECTGLFHLARVSLQISVYLVIL